MKKYKAALISLGSLSSQWTIQAMEKYFNKVDEIDIRKIEVSLKEPKPEVLYDGKPFPEYDCVYAKGSFKYANLLRSVSMYLCDKTFIPIKPSAFTNGHDKLLTQLKLQAASVPMPKTYLAPTSDAAKLILKKMNFPIIMKFPQGTHGKGVMFADGIESAASMLDALAALKQPFLIQEYVETGGVDTRAIVIGNKVVAAMKRKAVQGEKRANIHTGGTGEATHLDHNTNKVAIEAAKALGCHICAVDILESARGPKVLEINLSPGLQGITEYTKIDVADKIAKYLFEKTAEFKEGKQEKTSKILKDMGIQEGEEKEIISNLDFRGDRILLPEIVTKLAKFDEKTEVCLKIKNKSLKIDEFSIE